jgi:hypothetical protein
MVELNLPGCERIGRIQQREVRLTYLQDICRVCAVTNNDIET